MADVHDHLVVRRKAVADEDRFAVLKAACDAVPLEEAIAWAERFLRHQTVDKAPDLVWRRGSRSDDAKIGTPKSTERT